MLELVIKAYKHKHNMKNRDSYQTDELVSISPNYGGPSTKSPLKVMHQKL